MKVLTLEELHELCERCDIPPSEVAYDIKAIERHMQNIAERCAAKLNVAVATSYEAGFAGLCSTFSPLADGAPVPPEFNGLDDDGDWETSEAFSERINHP